MHIGETLLAGSDLFTPWFAREADNAIFTYESITIAGDATLTVTVYTKNSEDTSEGALAATGTVTTTTSGSFTKLKVIDGLEELVRFKITVTGNPISGELLTPGSCVPDTSFNVDPLFVSYVVYRFLQPTWFNKA
ncbi:MAG: hypothetical protein ACYTGW_15185 [Planctomycetota bacterium]|jgi:hypothetical protein